METPINILFWFVLVICSGTVAAAMLLVGINIRRVKGKPGRVHGSGISQALYSFVSAGPKSKIGSSFVRLIELGFLTMLTATNHSKEFNDNTHLQDFREDNTPEIAAALSKIGREYGQHYI